MHRGDGLVQRRNVNAAASPKENKDSDDEKSYGNRRDEEEDDRDSKETRLTLMEEVLLLGLKDKEVRFGVAVIIILFAVIYAPLVSCVWFGYHE